MPDALLKPLSEEQLKLAASQLPEAPGVYKYFDAEGTIIYVGKAKNLRKRVSSYFNRPADTPKTAILVRTIRNIEFIVVEGEDDALLLENSLIKKYQPRYNILLKDDKAYPWICIKSEPFPRVFYTRRQVKDGSQYFGPYASVPMVRAVMEFLSQAFQIRTCKLNLAPQLIAKGNYKVCLEYHIGNCKGPCTGNQDEKEYAQTVAQIKHILKGNIAHVKEYFKNNMAELAAQLRFEEAQTVKERLELLDRYQSKSTVVSPTVHNVDVFSTMSDIETIYINFLRVANGCIIQSYTSEVKRKTDETEQELLPGVIAELWLRYGRCGNEIVLPYELDFLPAGVQATIPQRGDRKSLLELSERNLKFYRLEKLKQVEVADPERHAKRILETARRELQMNVLPEHIECFDNSNIQGKFAVSACVVFKNAKPSKKDYRHFNVKTVEGPDDFATMTEVLTRRYSRLVAENEPLPQLIVIDGGKGQLGAAVDVLQQLGIADKLTVIGIAKRLEEIFFPGDPVPLYLDRNSETLKMIQHLRNEAHRFGITHHRNQRSKHFITSELDSIEGVGPKTIELLLKNLKTIDAIKASSVEELAAYIGKAKAELVHGYFHPASPHQ